MSAPVGELWAIHAQGPDDLYPAFSRDDAERHAAQLNALPMPGGIAVSAVVIPSPLPADQHWKCLAEQEREHRQAVNASAARAQRIADEAAREIIEAHAIRPDAWTYLLADATVFSDRHIEDCLDHLEQRGLIDVEPTADGLLITVVAEWP